MDQYESIEEIIKLVEYNISVFCKFDRKHERVLLKCSRVVTPVTSPSYSWLSWIVGLFYAHLSLGLITHIRPQASRN